MYVSAFIIGVAALFVFALSVYWGHVEVGSDLFVQLLQINGYAYFSAAAGLFLFRFSRTPPKSVEIDEEGLTFGFEDGRREFVTWSDAQGETGVFDREEPMGGNSGSWILVTLPGYHVIRTLAFMRPRVPRTFLTKDAADAVLAGAERAGLTVTKYGNRYVLERRNPMEFHPKVLA